MNNKRIVVDVIESHELLNLSNCENKSEHERELHLIDQERHKKLKNINKHKIRSAKNI